MIAPEKEFNLLDEPWIRVQTMDNLITEVSLTDALLDAHRYKNLACELPTLNVAVLRVLLAVLHTVFQDKTALGEDDPIYDYDTAIERWKTLWTFGRIPEGPVQGYLGEHREKFWLFHPERPFWQVPEAKIGTFNSAAKLNGEMLESDNKSRLFLTKNNQAGEGLSFAEAARWLLHVNGFDDTSGKPKGKNLPSPGAGYLGKIGLLYAKGDNLFETLLLNLVLFRDDEDAWGDNVPTWNAPRAKADERTEIPVPQNLAELYTLQSRRLLLERKENRVMGYYLLGGDFFNREDAFAEPMTSWRKLKAKKTDTVDHFMTLRHTASKQMWREFTSTFGSHLFSNGSSRNNSHDFRTSGIVRWLIILKRGNHIPNGKVISICTAGVQYGDKDFYVTNIFGDALDIHAGLIADISENWLSSIEAEVSNCERIAWEIEQLANHLSIAAGGDPGIPGINAKEQFYSLIDIPFRNWLRSIDPDNATNEDNEEVIMGWRKTVREIAYRYADELVANAGISAFVGREVTNKKNVQDGYYSAPKAFNSFVYHLSAIQKKGE